MSSLSGRTNNNKNIPKFPNDIGTAGQFIKLKSDVNDGFEYVDVVDFSLPIASSNTLGGVKINGGNLAITNDGLLSSTNTEYTAGTNISITNDVISATNTEYTAGTNISITNDVISATNTEYTAGSNISITDDVISATNTEYTAGSNISITDEVISATNTEYTAGSNISITDEVISATNTEYTAGSNISITDEVISATNTEYTAGSNISITDEVISATVPTLTSQLTNNSGFITDASNINNTLIQTTRQEIIGDTQPQLYIRPSATSGRDATLTLEGRRNNNSNINTTYLKFTNFDDNDGANGSTAIVGIICGAVSNAADNTGRLRFYTSSTGSNSALCLSLDSDNSATFYGNVTFSNTPKDSSNYSYITTHSTNTLLNKSFTYDSISDPPSIPSGNELLPTVSSTAGQVLEVFLSGGVYGRRWVDLPTIPSGNELLPTVSSTAGQVLEVYEVSSGVYGRRWVDLPSIPSGNELLPTVSSTAGQVLEVYEVSSGVYGRRWVDLPSIPSGNELLPTLSSTAGQVLEVFLSGGVYGRRWVDLPSIPSGNELLPTVSSTAGQVLEVYEVSSGVYGRRWVDLPSIPSGNELLPTLSSTAGQVLEVFLSSGVYGRRWVDLPTIPSGNELLPTLSSTAGQVLEVYEVSSGVYGRRWVDLPSIPSGNELLPTLSSTAGQVLEVYEVSSGVYGRRWVDLPVVDTCFNRFSTNACDSVALYGKIAQVSSDTYQEVLTELQYTGGGLGAAAYLSANLGDFTNNVGFITTLPSNLPNFNEALTSSITDGKLLRVGQDSNNNKVIKYESDTNKLVPDITTDGYFLRSDIAGTTQSLTWAEIPSIPTNSPNFNESLTSSITDGKLLRVGQDSNNNKVIKYESDTNKLVPDITTDGYFLRSDIAGTTQSLTWAEIPSIPTNSPNFNESLTSSITDGDFLRVGTSGGNKVIKYETVDVIEDLTSYTQPGAISINTDSTLSLKQNSQTRIQIPAVGNSNSAGRVDLLLGKLYTDSADTGQGELRFNRADNQAIRYHSIFTQHDNSPTTNIMKFAIHTGSSSATTDQTDVLTLNGSGMVGIGDVTPLHGKLQVGGDIFACSEPITGGNTGNANVICKQLRIYADNENLMIGANNSQLKIRGASSNGIGFYGTNQSQGNEYMRITDRTYDNTTAGNIGIGLINPTEKLEVNGTVKATDFKFPLTGGGTFLVSNLYNNYVTLDTAVGTVTNTVNNLDIPNLTSFSQVAEISLTSTGNSIKLRTGPTTRLEVGNDGNVSIGGNLTCGSYAGLPIAGTADYGIVLIGGASSGLSVSTGVLSANSTTLVETGSSALMTSGGIASLELVSVATALEVQFKLYLVQEMNVNSKDYNWNQSGTTIGSESVYSEGIALVQGGAEFRCTKAGTFTISFLIVCDNGASNNRASFYTKVVKKFSGSEVKDYYVGGNTYYRDNDNNYDEICLCATINLTLKVNESFLIRSIRLFSEGSGSIPTHSSSELTIERVDQQTVVSSP